MSQTYKFTDVDSAIEMLQNLKKLNIEKGIAFTIDFDNQEESKKIVTPDDSCLLIRKSKTIIVNEDTYIPHMQVFSTNQSDLKNIRREGKMHDIIFVGL